MNFKNLNLDKEKLEIFISDFAEQHNATYQMEKKNDQLEVCTLRKDKAKPAKLNIYHIKNGKTTLGNTVGKNKELSTALAVFLKENCGFGTKYRTGDFVLNGFTRENNELITEYLLDVLEAELIKDVEIEGGELRKFKGKNGDELTICFYNKEKLMVQGMPLALFHALILFFYEIFDDKAQLIQQQIAVYDVKDDDINESTIDEELKSVLPNAYNQIEQVIKDTISPSLVMRRLDLSLGDYTCFAAPVLKGLEGVLKQILSNKSIPITNNFGEWFVPNNVTGLHVIDPSIQNKFTAAQKSVLEKMYSHYQTYRHVNFHMKVIVSTTVLLEEEPAKEIISETLALIDSFFKP